MSERIVFADGTVFQCPEQSRAVVHPFRDRSREWKLLCVCGELPAVKEKFVDGAVYFHEWDSLFLDAGGEERSEVIRQELSEYSIAGDLVDSRDGTISVYMGKPTELEETQAALDALLLLELGDLEI
ncbi:MAG: hypothetical protein Q4B50_02935 [Bacillota bacterium]|nr:hypothetical protein [Bacillota bacterium]